MEKKINKCKTRTFSGAGELVSIKSKGACINTGAFSLQELRLTDWLNNVVMFEIQDPGSEFMIITYRR